MTVFFYICEYFGITPKEFFDVDVSTPSKIKELADAAGKLPPDQLEHLLAIVKAMGK